MTVINSTRKVRANGDGAVVEFQFSFPAKVATDIVVKKILNSTGVATTQTVSTDYTIVLNTVTEGGTITYTIAPSALEDSFIIRETTQDQQTALPIGGNFPEISVENEIDRSRLIDIEIQETLDRAITLSETETLTGITLPLGANVADRIGKALVWNTVGDNLTLGGEIGNFTGDWATATAYIVRDLIKDTSNGNIYYCNTAHTSSGAEPISSNADVAKWDLIVDAASATASAAAAASSATDAETAQAAAETAQTNAETAQTNAETAQTNAETAETNAETAQVAAETAQTNAETALDEFTDLYLGAKASDPTLDNDGDALVSGALYFNTNDDLLKAFNGSAWLVATLSATSVVSKTNVTGSAVMPSGTFGERDGSPVAGYTRWNTTSGEMERYDGTQWGGLNITRGLIAGLTTSNDAGTPLKDVNVTEGEATDSTNVDIIKLGSEITKQINASWAVGDDAGGLDGSESVGGAPDVSTWYHVFVIKRNDTGVVDVLFSESATAPTLPTNYDTFRRIGSVFVGSGSNIYPHSQIGDEFLLSNTVNDFNVNAPGTSATSRALTVPTGIQVRAIFTISLIDPSPSQVTNLLITALDQADTAPTNSIYTVRNDGTNGSNDSSQLHIRTNTSGQIRTRLGASDSGIFIEGVTYGWLDRRGQDG